MASAAPSRDPRLVVRFAVYAGVALVLALGAGLLLARMNVDARARSDVERDATTLATRLGQDDLARTAFMRSRGDVPLLDDFLSSPDLGAGVVRIALVSPDGWVTYSTNHTEIGSRVDTRAFRKAASGDTVSTRKRVENRDSLESLVPVNWVMDPNRARGVLVVDRDYAPVAHQIHQSFLAASAAIGLALLILYLSLLPIMHRVTRMLQQRAERVEQQAAELRRTLAERERLAAIVDSSNDAIIGKDLDGRITTWNAAAEHLYGWTWGEVVGRPIELLVPPTPAGAAHAPGELLEQLQELALCRTVHVRKDGTPVDVSVGISPIRDESGAIVGSSVSARDVTQLRQLEDELREAHRQEAVGTLAVGVARDFDDLLAAISASNKILLDHLAPNDPLRTHLELIRRATEEGSDITGRLLAFGAGQAAEPRVLDVNELVHSMSVELRRVVGERVDLVTELAPDVGLINADPTQMEQLLVNLAVHGRDEMPAGGTLTVQTANVDFARRRDDRNGSRNDGHYVMVAISDTGRQADRRSSTRPFQHTRQESEERVALGLVAVWRLVQQAGGTMGVETHPHNGATIRVYLPRVDELPAAGELVA